VYYVWQFGAVIPGSSCALRREVQAGATSVSSGALQGSSGTRPLEVQPLNMAVHKT
jgi:hypothetical protein